MEDGSFLFDPSMKMIFGFYYFFSLIDEKVIPFALMSIIDAQCLH
jgi:hypothetical protein